MAGTLVLGVGNALLSDEGVGIHAVAELERRYEPPPELEFLDGGTSGIELLRHILGRERLIVIDAMSARKAPGTVTRLEGGEVPALFRTRISPHQLGLSDLLAAGLLSGELPETLVLFGVEPESLDTGLELSPVVADALEGLLAAVVTELAEHGHVLSPRSGAVAGKTARFWDSYSTQA